MSRLVFLLRNAADRQKAVQAVMEARPGAVVEVRQDKRSLEQNAKLWASLTELSQQLCWHGQKLSADDWKLVMLDGLHREMRIVPNLDGDGFVNLGKSSSSLTKGEMSQLIELIHAFGAQHGVRFRTDDWSNVEEPAGIPG